MRDLVKIVVIDEVRPIDGDGQRPADDEVVFVDGVGAWRSSIKSCHDGVQWIRVGDRVYWPLSDSDAKRLQSACCGNGSFDGPTTGPDGIGVQSGLAYTFGV